MKKKHIGSTVDSFLKEEGIYEECQAIAIKNIIAMEIEAEMIKNNITENEMAKRMQTSRKTIRRLLDPKDFSITEPTINKAMSVFSNLGKYFNK